MQKSQKRPLTLFLREYISTFSILLFPFSLLCYIVLVSICISSSFPFFWDLPLLSRRKCTLSTRRPCPRSFLRRYQYNQKLPDHLIVFTKNHESSRITKTNNLIYKNLTYHRNRVFCYGCYSWQHWSQFPLLFSSFSFLARSWKASEQEHRKSWRPFAMEA